MQIPCVGGPFDGHMVTEEDHPREFVHLSVPTETSYRDWDGSATEPAPAVVRYMLRFWSPGGGMEDQPRYVFDELELNGLTGG